MTRPLKMRRRQRLCAFLTTDDLDTFVVDDHLAYPALERLGWRVEAVPWRGADIDWARFDLVVIRTPWDYQSDPEAFLSVLKTIERSSATLENPVSTVRWNLRKTYLCELEARGVNTVPSVYGERFEARKLPDLSRELQAEELVIKPVIGANAEAAFRISPHLSGTRARTLEAAYRDRPHLVQPFLPAVVEEGEFSLFYFAGRFSHAVLKTPAEGDFRTQEEHGAVIRAVPPAPPLLACAQSALDVVERTPLYARADLVGDETGRYLLMELELIEPSLYLRMDPEAPARFARAIDSWV